MQLVERTLQALSILSKETNGLSVTELSEKMGIPASSTHRVLTCLKDNFFVSQNTETKKYQIGYKLLTLCSNISKENSFTRAARPFMQDLSDRIAKTVTLCVMEGESVICLDYIENKDTTMFLVRTGFAMPPQVTSAGKVIQAYMPREQVTRIYNNTKIDQFTDYTKTSLAEFLEELQLVRQNGYAVCDEELQLGVQGVACPIFDFNGKVVGSVSFTAIKADNCVNPQTIALLKDCAEQISRSLGNIQN